jgi:hypothetical protein
MKIPELNANNQEAKRMNTKPKTVAEINARLSEVGAEMASYRFTPHRIPKELGAEEDRLKADLVVAMERESEAEVVRQRVEKERREQEAKDRDARIDAEVKRQLAAQ